MVSSQLTINFFKKGVRVMDLGPSHERMNMFNENSKVLAFTVAF
jgi:hypothetical protein